MKNIGRLAFAVVAFFSTGAQAETVLRYSNWLPPTHALFTEVITPWAEDVERVTEGRVRVEFLPKVVGSVPNQFEVIRDGLADVAFIIDGYSVGRFNLGGIIELPFLGNDVEALSVAYWSIYKDHLEAFGEYEGVVPIAKSATGPSTLTMKSVHPDSIADLEGLKLRVATATATRIARQLGVVPVSKPISEMYELLSTGVVDGMFAPAESIVSFDLARSIEYIVHVDGGLTNTGTSIIMNADTLSALSDADQEAFWTVSGEHLSARMGAVLNVQDRKGVEELEAADHTYIAASQSFEAELRAQLAPIENEWIDEAATIGLADPAAVLAEFRARVRELEAANRQ